MGWLMKKTTLAGLACGLCCSLCVGLYMAEVRGEVDEARAEALARYGGEQVEVCVATRDLAPGEVVDGSAVATKMWVADLLPDGAVTEPSGIVGQRLGSAVIKGEVLSVRRTEAQEADISVPQGLAAISVPARAVQAVGGSVEAGMQVDVFATGPVSTTRLVEGALVLASSASAETGSAAASNAWITLAVAPERVQEIVSAAQNLELYFALPATAGSESGGAEAALDGAVEVPADGGAVPSDTPASEQEAAAIEAPPAEESAPSEAPSAEGAVL